MLSTVLLVIAAVPAAGDSPSSLQALRAQRVALVSRIAALTDTVAKAEAAALAARERRFVATAALDEARRNVARYLVDAYVEGIDADGQVRQRLAIYTDIAANEDEVLLDRVAKARAAADGDAKATEKAVAEAQDTMAKLQALRTQLEQTIAEREPADAENDAARRARTPPLAASPTPAYSRTTFSQRELFARYPFGPVGGTPGGLVATGGGVSGPASWYGPGFDGKPTASGAIYDQEGWTVASKELPLGTILLIHYNGRSVLALVNDRGPYVRGRVLDLSHGVARALGTDAAGVADVTAEVLAPA